MLTFFYEHSKNDKMSTFFMQWASTIYKTQIRDIFFSYFLLFEIVESVILGYLLSLLFLIDNELFVVENEFFDSHYSHLLMQKRINKGIRIYSFWKSLKRYQLIKYNGRFLRVNILDMTNDSLHSSWFMSLYYIAFSIKIFYVALRSFQLHMK